MNPSSPPSKSQWATVVVLSRNCTPASCGYMCLISPLSTLRWNLISKNVCSDSIGFKSWVGTRWPSIVAWRGARQSWSLSCFINGIEENEMNVLTLHHAYFVLLKLSKSVCNIAWCHHLSWTGRGHMSRWQQTNCCHSSHTILPLLGTVNGGIFSPNLFWFEKKNTILKQCPSKRQENKNGCWQFQSPLDRSSFSLGEMSFWIISSLLLFFLQPRIWLLNMHRFNEPVEGGKESPTQPKRRSIFNPLSLSQKLMFCSNSKVTPRGVVNLNRKVASLGHSCAPSGTKNEANNNCTCLMLP